MEKIKKDYADTAYASTPVIAGPKVSFNYENMEKFLASYDVDEAIDYMAGNMVQQNFVKKRVYDYIRMVFQDRVSQGLDRRGIIDSPSNREV